MPMRMSRKMKVVMVGPSLKMQGGVASVAKGYVQGGLGEMFDLSYIGTACDGSSLKKALTFMGALARFRRELPSADIVHIHASMRGSFERKFRIASMAKKNGVPIIIHEHDGEFAALFEGADEAYRSKVLEFFAWADRVIVLSEEWRDYFVRNVCDSSKIEVMHNAVALPEFQADPCARQDVLFLGRLGARDFLKLVITSAATGTSTSTVPLPPSSAWQTCATSSAGSRARTRSASCVKLESSVCRRATRACP